MATPRKTTSTRQRGRPPTKPRAAPADDLIGSSDPEKAELAAGLDLGVVYGGVSASWLAHVFAMDKNTVKKKLAQGCTIVGKNKGTPLYTIKEAASYLVPPKVDLQTYVRGLRPNDLPPILNSAYWDAMLKRQKWEVLAGELWHTKDVMDVFGRMAMAVKSTVQLWPEQVRGLSDKQRKDLEDRCDSLLNEIHDIMIAQPLEGHTTSSAEEDGVADTYDDEDEEDALI